MSINFTNVLSVTVVLFAIIDVLGSIPLFLSFKQKDDTISPAKAAGYSFIILTGFLFIGKWMLHLFNVDVSSFAVAGSLVIFILSVEMVLGIEIFKFDAPGGSLTLVPVVFPLIAGPGTFTALLSMRAEYDTLEIILGIFINMVAVFVVLRYLDLAKRFIGEGGVYVLRKFFGIILMAIAVRLFTTNIHTLFANPA